MKKTEIRTLDMLRRVRQFMLARIDAFPANSPGHRLYLTVVASIGNMERCSAEQSVQAHAYGEKSAQKNVAEDALRDLMEAISRTARSMSREFPGAKEKFRLPSKNDGETWLTFARDFSTEAVPFEEEFVARGLAPDFIDDLKARILAVVEADAAQAKAWGERVEATAGLADAAQKGAEAVRELDVIVRNVFKGNETELAAWESASHVERAARRAEEEEEETPAPPAPATVSQ